MQLLGSGGPRLLVEMAGDHALVPVAPVRRWGWQARAQLVEAVVDGQQLVLPGEAACLEHYCAHYQTTTVVQEGMGN